jgi:hypothetical protein
VITGHGISKWCRHNFLLGLIPVVTLETTCFIADTVTSALAEWHIPLDVVVNATTDGTANMKSAVVSQLGWPWLYCIMHALN